MNVNALISMRNQLDEMIKQMVKDDNIEEERNLTTATVFNMFLDKHKDQTYIRMSSNELYKEFVDLGYKHTQHKFGRDIVKLTGVFKFKTRKTSYYEIHLHI